MWAQKTQSLNPNKSGRAECICIILIQHAFPVTTIMALWQLVHLGTSMYGYMLLAFITGHGCAQLHQLP